MKLRFSLRSLFGVGLCLLAACSDNSAPDSAGATSDSTPAIAVPATGPAITASPNPAPTTGSSMATTIVAWNTGGEPGDVYISTNGTDEKLFAHGAYGVQEAPWIAAGTKYEFRLYNAEDRTKPVASVVVTRSP